MNRLSICNNSSFFISPNSFKQHYIIQKTLRKYINFLIYNLYDKLIEKNAFPSHLSQIVCIGGESYLFGLCNNFNSIVHYTNSQYIYNDAHLNNSIYKKKLENNLIDYNKYSKIKNSDLLIINLAKLHINLLNQINKRYYKYIIIINCHHEDFWKKIKLLTNFKIISRKQFIVTNYFVTATLFQYKSNIPLYISLGNTCAIAHQLKDTGLRTQSFPFDWCKISLNQLNKVLNNDFENFNDLKVIKFSDNHPLENCDHGSYLLKNPYNILFAHELYKINNYNINNLKSIINNRVINFKNAKNENIRFVIHKSFIDNSGLNKLISNLQQFFTNFKIIYITNSNNISNKLELDNLTVNCNSIKIITIDYNIINWEDWKLNSINWFDLFFNKI
jgi:hypothetical protein